MNILGVQIPNGRDKVADPDCVIHTFADEGIICRVREGCIGDLL